MDLREDEYLLLYKGDVYEDKQAHGYAIAIERVKINEWDIQKNPLTRLQVKEVADHLGVPVADLYDPADSSNPGDYDEDELLKILSHDPSQMKTPIILSKEKSFFVASPYDLVYEKLATRQVKASHHEKRRGE